MRGKIAVGFAVGTVLVFVASIGGAQDAPLPWPYHDMPMQIVNAVSSNMCLTTNNYSNLDGTQVLQWYCQDAVNGHAESYAQDVIAAKVRNQNGVRLQLDLSAMAYTTDWASWLWIYDDPAMPGFGSEFDPISIPTMVQVGPSSYPAYNPIGPWQFGTIPGNVLTVNNLNVNPDWMLSYPNYQWPGQSWYLYSTSLFQIRDANTNTCLTAVPGSITPKFTTCITSSWSPTQLWSAWDVEMRDDESPGDFKPVWSIKSNSTGTCIQERPSGQIGLAACAQTGDIGPCGVQVSTSGAYTWFKGNCYADFLNRDPNTGNAIFAVTPHGGLTTTPAVLSSSAQKRKTP